MGYTAVSPTEVKSNPSTCMHQPSHLIAEVFLVSQEYSPISILAIPTYPLVLPMFIDGFLDYSLHHFCRDQGEAN